MTKRLSQFREVVVFILFVLFALALLATKEFSSATLFGINLWITCVLPALFPYFFITAALSSLKITGKIANKLSPVTTKLFNTGGAVGYAYLMSIISGYPLGAKIVSDLKLGGALSDSESVRAAAVCSTSSPMFLIGSVGNIMFSSPLFGACLFICHLISSVIVGVIFSFYKRKDKPNPLPTSNPLKSVDNLLYECAYSAVVSVLVVGGLITIFYLITEILLYFNVLDAFIYLLTLLTDNQTISQGVILGLFECTKGLKILALEGIGTFTLPLCALICGFGGLSVIAQSTAYLKKAKIKTAPFILSKIIAAVISFAVGIVISLFCL